MSLYRLSDSSLKLLHTCERFFQLERLLSTKTEKQHFPATILGTAYGVGVAHYLATQNLEESLYKTWLAYFPILEDDIRTEEICINLLLASVHELDKLLADWEVVSFQGRPAVEMSFRIDIDEKFYFVGYIDVVLRNRYTGRCAVLDCKSTSVKLYDLSPLYQNSNQCLSYSVAIDSIVGEENAEYDVMYFVGKLGSGNGFSPEIKPYIFPKTLNDRLDWFISLGMDVKHIQEMLELGIFPRRGDSCLQFNRACKHFGTCQLHSFDELSEPEEDTIEYQFRFQLSSLIQHHIERIENHG